MHKNEMKKAAVAARTEFIRLHPECATMNLRFDPLALIEDKPVMSRNMIEHNAKVPKVVVVKFSVRPCTYSGKLSTIHVFYSLLLLVQKLQLVIKP